MAAKKPIIPTVQTNFGPVVEDASFYDGQGAGGDVTYVPGYSDMRRLQDQGKTSHPLPVRLQWTRNARVSGEPDGRKEWEYGADGYKTVKESDIGQSEWLTAMPPAASIAADGSIRMQDMTLMVTDQKRAARNAARVQLATERQITGIGSKLLSQGDKVKGSEPTVESKRADKALGQE